MRFTTPSALAALVIFASASPLAAQRYSPDTDAEWLDHCRSGWNGDDDRGRACEVRAVAVRPASRSLQIDGRQNGGIRVQGWDGDTVRVTARLQASARSDSAAAALLRAIRIVADGSGIRAEGPSESGYDEGSREGWSASYVVWAPRRFDLSLDAHNGGIGVTGVAGKMDLRTVNGSVSLTDIGGDVHARTQNGSLNVQLAGNAWDGTGLDAETQNGAVRLAVPARYSAVLETGTVNGTINTDFPVTVQGRISRRLSLPLNGGGRTIRAITTNGSVRISQR
jgi:hypothetical protein